MPSPKWLWHVGGFGWRRVLFWGLLAVVAAGVIVLCSPYWFPTDWLRRRLDQELERALPVKAKVGELSVRVGLGLRARWRDLALVSDAEGVRLSLSAESGEVEVPLRAILGGALRVPTVTLETVRVSLRVGPEGLRPLLARWQAKEKERKARAETERKAGKGRERPSFEVENVLISDLVFNLLDAGGSLLQRSPSIDLSANVRSLAPVDVRLKIDGHPFVLAARLRKSTEPAGGLQASGEVRNLHLDGLGAALRLLLSPQAPKVVGVLEEGTMALTQGKEQLTIEVAGALRGLEVETTDRGSLSAARLLVPQARIALRPGKDRLECTVEKLAFEAEAFDLSAPLGEGLAPSVGKRPLASGFHFAGSRLTGVLAGSATLALSPAEGSSPGHVTASVRVLEPIHLVEASLTAAGESEPLAAVAEAWLSGAAADATWRAGEPFGPSADGLKGAPAAVTLSGELNFAEAGANGLLARLGLPVSAAPVGGKVNFHARFAGARSEEATGEAHLRSQSLAVKSAEADAAVGPWELSTSFSVSPSEDKGLKPLAWQLELTGARWSGQQLSLTANVAGGPRALSAASSALSGSLSILPDGDGWSVAASGEGSLGSLSLAAADGEAVSADALQVSGSVGGTYTDGKPHLTALDATASVLGGRANERVLAGAEWLPPGLRSVGVALAGDAEAEAKYDGLWFDLSAAGTGREVVLSSAQLFGPSPLRLNGMQGEVAVRLAADLSEVVLNQCQLESPEFEASARGVVRSTGGTYSLQLLGRLATSWSAAGPSWVALAEALPAKLHDALVRFSFEGRASLEDVVVKGPLAQLSLAGEVNLDGSAVRFDQELLKEVGTRGRMPLRLALGERVRLQDLALELEGLPRVQLAGETDRGFSEAQLRVSIEQLEKAPLKEFRPELARLVLSGGLTLEALLENVRDNGTGWVRFHFDHLGVEVTGPEAVRVELDGTVAVTPASISWEDLHVTADGNDLTVSGRLEGYLGLLARLAKSPDESASGPAPLAPDGEETPGGAAEAVPAGRGEGEGEKLPRLRLDVRAEVLDLSRLERVIVGEGAAAGARQADAGARPLTDAADGGTGTRSVSARADPPGALPGQGTRATQSPSSTVVELVPPEAAAAEAAGASQPDAGAEQLAIDREAVLDWLSRWLPRLGTELAASGSVEVGEVRISRASLRDFKAAWELTDGVLRTDVCQGAMSGGQFDAGGTEVHLDRWPPSYTCVYRTFDLESDPSVTQMVGRRFPGLTFSGRMDDEGTLAGLASADPGEWASSVSGETRSSLTDGTLLIPLPIPAYVRQLFPSLNASAYRFSRMTNEATIEAGVWYNTMKFDGYPELYVAGTTSPDGRVDYQAGLRVLKTVAGPAGPMVADVGQLPVSHFTGRIQGTEFVELEGAFVTLPELVSRLLADGLYRGFKKGVLDLGYLRSFQKSVPVPGLDLFVDGLDFVLDVTIRLIPGLGKEKPAEQPQRKGAKTPS